MKFRSAELPEMRLFKRYNPFMNETFNPYKARIDLSQHTQHSWIAHDLLTDFEVEDVWRLPVVLSADQPISTVRDVLMDGLAGIQESGMAGLLFKLRHFIGRIFGWDDESEPTTTLRAGSLRERYATTNSLTAEQLPKPIGAEFAPVYVTENESLDEIENATVHAGLHLGRVLLDKDRYMAQLTIYVKPNGTFGRIYMAAIKPFRYWIVYPAMLRLVKRQWESAAASL